MKISTTELYRIILEEYIAEEGKTYPAHPAIDRHGGKPSPSSEDLLRKLSAHLSENSPGDDAAEELLKKIMGDKYEPPEVRHPARYAKKGGDTEPMQKPHTKPQTGADETMPVDLDIPSDDAPERDVSGFQDRAGPPLEDQLMDLIQGLPPEEVADLFQAVFEKIPGVELGEPEEEPPETLYSPGAEGRPQVGFKEELVELVYGRILEWGDRGSWGIRGIAGVTGKRDKDKDEDVSELEMADVKKAAVGAILKAPWSMGDPPGNRDDPHGFENMSDAELIDMMHTDGMEEMIVLDGEGDLANRDEVIAALQDV